MTKRTHPLADLITSGRDTSIEYGDLIVRRYSNGVLNIDTLSSDRLANEHLDAFRDDLRSAGYAEVESWIARQGMSWLSDGVFAGVSLTVRPLNTSA